MKSLSYISKDNSKVSFTNSSLTQKSYILRILFPHKMYWDWIDYYSILEFVSVKPQRGFNRLRYFTGSGMMHFPETLKTISSRIYNLETAHNLDEISSNKVHCNLDDLTSIYMIGNYIEERTHKLTFNFLER